MECDPALFSDSDCDGDRSRGAGVLLGERAEFSRSTKHDYSYSLLGALAPPLDFGGRGPRADD